MNGPETTHALWILLVGIAIVSAALTRAACARLRIPSLVGFLVLGLLLRVADDQWRLLTDPVRIAFDFLADLGVVALLFRVGLHSNLRVLVGKLQRASVIWVGNVLVSGIAGFVAARYVAGLGVMPSVVVGTALTATSVGVSTNVWQEARALKSPNGSLVVDVAELDDISAVLLMAIVFTVLPSALEGNELPWLLGLTIAGGLIVKLLLFTGLCLFVASTIEPRLTRLAASPRMPAQHMVTVAGVGLIVAALAEWLGFSLAIGALFAGLAFSRDPQAVRTEGRFEDLHTLFVPFFFMRIGMDASPAALVGGSAGLGVLLLGAAIAGKFIGAGLPAWWVAGPEAGVLIGLSMIPRAEIAMVVMYAGLRLGPEVVTERIFGAVLMVVLGTCLLTPWLLSTRLQRHQHRRRREAHAG